MDLDHKKNWQHFWLPITSFMQNLVSSHSVKTAIRLIVVVALLFILVNLLA